MPSQAKKQKTDLIERIAKRVGATSPKTLAVHATTFARAYLSGMSAEDLLERGEKNLEGIVASHWQFTKQRKAGETKVRAFNPSLQEHGFESPHTVVEIITDDMPFLVDSIRMAVNELGLTNHLTIHPILRLARNKGGRLTALFKDGRLHHDWLHEAVMHVEVDRTAEQSQRDVLVAKLSEVLGKVHAAVEDWQQMRARLRDIVSELRSNPPPVPGDELDEGNEFLKWLNDDHFTYLGYREYRLRKRGSKLQLFGVKGTGLGLLRERDDGTASRSFANLPPKLQTLAKSKRLLVITKGSHRSMIHRPGHLDFVGIKQFGGNGEVTGEHRFFGLYTAGAYNRSPRSIPLLRKKVAEVLRNAGSPDDSHDGKVLMNILETFPRDELFQISPENLLEISTGILGLQERQQVRLFVHPDPFERFISCLVYVPKDRFNTDLRRQIQEILRSSFNGESTEFNVSLTESALTRLYFVVRVPAGQLPSFDVKEIEAKIKAVTRNWRDDLANALNKVHGELVGSRLYRKYGHGFRADYREQYSAEEGAQDTAHMEVLSAQPLSMAIYKRPETPANGFRLKLFRYQNPVPLSDALPILENMGLKVIDEQPSKIKPEDTQRVWCHDFGLEHRESKLNLEAVENDFLDTFAKVWNKDAENDGLNRLVLRAGLSWREIVVLRGYCKYLRQVQGTFSQAYMQRALNNNPGITRHLIALFHQRFDPDGTGDRGTDRIPNQVLKKLDDVSNLDEDRILRAFLGVVQATTRTNFYQCTDAGENKPCVSFKFNPALVPEMPEPKPMFEIFVYSPRVEGVHMRGGKVARGGLRWSDRREDFRTEVLGLVKAQMVKNAVIVPVGSKGGFFPKRLNRDDRDEYMREGIACYKIFIGGLLDVTDNLVGDNVAPPPRVVRHDEDDSYLVVAADKGTATFSDIANGIAEDYGFWLGDAFASGGSAGYDHKGMGITARGAWESVKRHFRERGLDTQVQDFAVMGIGDMAGDVFGNGMLLSKFIKLVGAFNHLHIFLDPEPNPATSYKERTRLFKLQRSSWEDYNAELISKGGGVFARSAKSIPLSPQVQSLLGVSDKSMPPNRLINAMLKASVDLLWNGGIGTYVKAGFEQDSDVGDRANDAVRVSAKQLRCKVVGEGGNLGFTQNGRIEFAAAGGRIYTDAIDNSAGVDCSDHEVNIKILLNAEVAEGRMTRRQRDNLLAKMTDEVGDLVLKNNYQQTQSLNLGVRQAKPMLEVHARLMRSLEKDGKLSRSIEFLPNDEMLRERKKDGLGLFAPEISVVLAYTKIALFEALTATDLPDDPYLSGVLQDYFPVPLQQKYSAQMGKHRLRREIVATEIVNGMVNRTGSTFAHRIQEETGAAPDEIAKAYVISREVFAMLDYWRAAEALDNKAEAGAQADLLLEGRKLVERAARWILRHRPSPLDIGANVKRYGERISEFGLSLADYQPASELDVQKAKARHYSERGVPLPLAHRAASFPALFPCLDIIDVAHRCDKSTDQVAGVYFSLGSRLNLHWLRDRINDLPRDNRWQALARAALRDDLYNCNARLTTGVLTSGAVGDGPGEMVNMWMEKNRVVISRCERLLTDLKAVSKTDFAMLSVAMGEVRMLRNT